MVAAAIRDEIPRNVTIAPADLVSQQAAEWTRHGTHERSEKRDRNRDRGELRLDQQRKRGRVADEGSEGPDIDEGT